MVDALLSVLVIAGLVAVSRYSYLVFHTAAELISIAIAWAFFAITWAARRTLDDDYFLLIGVGSLAIGAIDLVHTLAYKGMNLFPGYDADLPTQLWIAARCLQASALLAAGVRLIPAPRPRRPVNPMIALTAYGVVGALLIGSAFARVFPTCYVEGVGLTPFKRISEYVISAILLVSMALLWRARRRFDPTVLGLLLAFHGATIVSELAFTVYIGVTDAANLMGHILKMLAVYLFFRATVLIGFERPYGLLFRDLRQREETLRETNAHLREAVEQLHEAQGQLVREERLSAIGQLSEGIAHEFNNILAVISLNSDLALLAPEADFAEQSARVRGFVQAIKEEATRGAQLVQQMLDFAGRTMIQPEPVDLVPFLASEATRLRGSLPALITLEVTADLRECTVSADPWRLQQALDNLAANAAEAMPEGGVLRLALLPVPDGSTIECAECGPVETSDLVEIVVMDSGAGIAPEVLPRVLEPFFTTRCRAEASGLGLPQVHGIVKQHGGHIAIETRVGVGTTVHLYWPRFPDAHSAESRQCWPPRPPRRLPHALSSG